MRTPFSGRLRPTAGLGQTVDDRNEARSRSLAAGVTTTTGLEQSAARILAKLDLGNTGDVGQAVAALVAEERRAFDVASDGSFAGDVYARNRLRATAALQRQSPATIGIWESEVADLLVKAVPKVRSAALPGDAMRQVAIRFEVAAVALLDEPFKVLRAIIETALGWLPERPGEVRIGERTAVKIRDNLLAASGLSKPEDVKRADKLCWPGKGEGSAENQVKTYLGGTAFEKLLTAKLSFGIAVGDFCEHAVICARIGHGKTQALQTLIVELLSLPDPPSLVMIDPAGQMLQAIAELLDRSSPFVADDLPAVSIRCD